MDDQRMYQLFRTIVQYILSFNFFASIPPTTHHHQLKNELISTRIFIISLILCITVLLFYVSNVTTIKTVIIKEPTLKQYKNAYEKYSQTLTCPCTHIAISHNIFLNGNYTIHQSCLSDFVSNEWIDYLRQARDEQNIVLGNDFRLSSPFLFRALQTMCKLISDTIANSLTRFYSTQYVTINVVSLSSFYIQTQLIIDQFQSYTTNEFLSSLLIVQDSIQVNSFMSAIQTNAHMVLDYDYGVLIYSNEYADCNCETNPSCTISLTITMNSQSYVVQGMYAGCYVFNALLHSTLDCFYDDDCLNQLKSYISSSRLSNARTLNRTSLIQFNTTSTINDILQKLMVEKWHWTIDYDKYFDECHPSECSYTVKTRHDLVYIVTTLISMSGGLMTVLKVIVPILVNFVRRKRNRITERPVNMRRTLRVVFAHGLGHIRNLNLFPLIPQSKDQYLLKNQIISTRLFIISLIVSLVILIYYISCEIVTKSITVKSPTSKQYEQLYALYSQTLFCPCTQIAITYEIFLRGNYTFHHICSSDFITNQWIDYLHQARIENDIVSGYDFRMLSPFTFQALRSLCVLINETITNNLIDFYSNEFVNIAIIPQIFFDSQVQSIINQFQSNTAQAFLSTFIIVQNITAANFLFSSLQTNALVYPDVFFSTPSLIPMEYEDCSCLINDWCIVPSIMFNVFEIYDVRGMYAGCYIFNALLHSTLDCFYDDDCLNQLKSYISSSRLSNARTLNRTSLIQFNTTSTINDILQKLMVEKWHWTIDYDKYFDECHPSECSYTVKTRHDLVYIVTTLISMSGGLMTVLKVIVPIFVNLIRRRKFRSIQQVLATSGATTKNLIHLGMDYMCKLNIFTSSPSTSVSNNQLRTEILATRVFIICFIVLMFTLLLYMSTVILSNTISIKTPTVTLYKQMYEKYSRTLVCPCTQISVKHGIFVRGEHVLHQVCSSDFVNDDWIDYLRQARNDQIHVFNSDFLQTGRFAFQALQSLCKSVNNTLANSFIRFYSNQYVTIDVTPSHLFHTRVGSIIDQFLSNTINEFLLSLRIIQDIVEINVLVSSFLTNAYIIIDLPFIYFESNVYENCSCETNASCIVPSNITAAFRTHIVRGMYAGCYVLNALLHSTLDCFYDDDCLNQLKSYISSSRLSNARTLNRTSLIQFNTTSTINDILQKLMVEKWHWTIDYDKYFDECRPSECSYAVRAHYSSIYIATTVVGLVGGLTTTLKLIVPRIVKIVMHIRTKRRNTRIVSISAAMND